MVKVNRIDHINMNVTNLNETLAFYKDIFGFSVKEQGNRQGTEYAIIGLKDTVYLCVYETGEKEHLEEGLRLKHFGLHVEGFENIEEQLRQYGVTINYGGAVQQGKSRSLYIEDPSGHEIELAEYVGGNLK